MPRSPEVQQRACFAVRGNVKGRRHVAKSRLQWIDHVKFVHFVESQRADHTSPRSNGQVQCNTLSVAHMFRPHVSHLRG
uniref:Uncharacterized protein n=1 Tax=Hyaloperonospora arabidopsidis (strain Emoy2) TaxID=559515 RepID=M4BGN2_HYAAE